MNKFVKALLSVLFLNGGANAIEVYDLVARVEKITSQNPYKDFYGNAILFHQDAHWMYWVTNAHVLRHHADKMLFLKVNASKGGPIAAEIVGVRPGYDLAVLKIAKNRFDELDKMGLLTLPIHQNQNFSDFFGRENAESLEGQKLIHGYTNGQQTSPDSFAVVKSQITSFCPIPFLTSCLLLNALTWGYSGSPLIVADQIVGVISHYSPLSLRTYALPIQVVLKVGQSIVRQPQAMADLDLDGLFQYLKAGSVKILQGRLADKIVSGFGGHVPGGGETQGGGGETQGGGPPTPRPTRSGLFGKGHRFFIGNMDQVLADLRRPKEWMKQKDNLITQILKDSPLFRGVEAFFRYRPGVQIDPFERIYFFNDHPLLSLQSFLKLYKDNSEGALKTEFTEEVLAGDFESAGTSDGVWSSLIIKSASKEIIETELGHLTRTPLVRNRVASFISDNSVVSFADEAALRRITSGAVNFDSQGVFRLFFRPEREGPIFLKVDHPLNQIGPRMYRYAGALKAQGDTALKDFYGFLTLQELKRGHYELKMVYGYTFTHKSNTFLSLQGLSLPLRRAKTKSNNSKSI